MALAQNTQNSFLDSKIKHKQKQRETITTTIRRFYAINVYINIGVTVSYRKTNIYIIK